MLVAVAMAVAFGIAWLFVSSPWPPLTTLKHYLAWPNCGIARWLHLAPARTGQPGYWARLDRDKDGIACEPWPRR
jgi:hypothetical protein